MPLFGRNRPPELTEEQREAAEVDLDRIRRGGIPLGAEERLKRIGTAGTPFFTSDLTTKEYALAQASGLQPVAQIMGSSVVQHGWSNYGWSTYYGGLQEMPSFAEPWNLARERAFDRLAQEAQFADADGVVGIDVNAKGALGEPNNVEYVVFGTAVRETAPPLRGGGRIGMCALSGQDVDKLRRIGAEVLGVIGHTSVVSVALDPRSNYIMNSRGFWGAGATNVEITEITRGVYAARQLAMEDVHRQARAAGANDMVISTLTHSIHHHEYEGGGITHHFFIVSMHVLGTAIRLGARDPHPAPMAAPIMSINLGR
ncbi:MAG: heavy metal-binding domain-containing protein [Solirubrobacterales bacterium]|nr:heavy metal-binding domain-containing protein [Solirubrobacterales bacterium]